MTDNILQTTIGLTPGEEVELYILDFNPTGINLITYFSPSDLGGASIWFGGKEFVARSIFVEGFEKSSDDLPPEPTLRFGNVDKGGNALLKQYNDLLGVKLTRLLTYSHFLDKLPNGSPNPGADSKATMLPEIWFIEQKIGNTPEMITWRLKAALDLQGKKIPARLILKNVCTRAYRVWNPAIGAFSYPLKNACPYAGAAKFTRAAVATTDPTKDECSKDLAGCKCRFAGQPLPGWFFPGVTRMPRSQ